jgi:hypothetical protein
MADNTKQQQPFQAVLVDALVSGLCETECSSEMWCPTMHHDHPSSTAFIMSPGPPRRWTLRRYMV